MLGTIKDPTLFLLFGSVGILLFGSIGYGIYTTVGPSSHKLRDTIQEHESHHCWSSYGSVENIFV